jgi:hypothetical protein
MDSRVVKPRIPARLIVLVAALGLAVIGFVILATSSVNRMIVDARMTGVVVSKEFIPAEAGEKRITLGRDGQINASQVEGEFILTVEVPQRDGTKRPFKVWMPDRAQFEAIQVGDSFDVGPRLAPSSN